MANPNDVFPRRNLPGDAEEWGRSVEDRIRNVEFSTLGQKQGLSGANRTSASTLQEIARQLVQLRGFYDDLADLYDAIPKVGQVSNTVTGFGLGSGWNTVATATLTVPPGSNSASLLGSASGQLVSTTTSSVITTLSRLVIQGTEGPQTPNAWYPGSGDFRSIMVPSWSRTVSVAPGDTLTVELQAYADDYTAYGYNAYSYAVISLIATFTG